MGEGDALLRKRLSFSFLDELRKRNEAQANSRLRLGEAAGLFDETKLRSLDSTLKKTTAFMKKLKNIGAGAGPSIIDEMNKLNLSKFVEEIAQAIAETRFKLSDVSFVVDLCVAVSCRYVAFPDLLLAELKKGLPLKKSDKISNPSKLRVDLRLIFELLLHGAFGKEGLQAFGGALAYLVQTDKTEHVNVGLLAGLATQIGWEMARIISQCSCGEVDTLLAELPVSGVVSSDQQTAIRGLFNDYLKSLLDRTGVCCGEMNRIQKRVKRQERNRGDATQEDRQLLENAKAKYEKLKRLSCEMCDALGAQTPDWKEEPSDDEEDELANQMLSRALDEGELSLWEDEETRAFYEKLIDIRKLVPSSLFKESEERTIDVSLDEVKGIEDVDVEGLEDEGLVEAQSATTIENAPEGRRLSAEESLPQEIQVDADGAEIMREQMMNFVKDLSKLVNRESVDTAALDFVLTLNTKINRRRLVRELSSLPRSHSDIIPFLARLVATLSPVMPDVPVELSQLLINQFREIVNGTLRKEFMDLKIRNVTFISELIKYEVISRAEALSCLRQLIYDFRGACIDLTCAMVECCGSYLYKSADSHAKMKQLLDVMVKKKQRIKDARQEMLIDNAYHVVCPPDGGRVHLPLRPPMYEFVKHLVINMREDTVDDGLRSLRRIDWKDEELSEFAVHALSSPWLLSFSQLGHLASALSGLSAIKFHEWTAIEVVDNLLETIRASLEVESETLSQSVTSCVAYLGELYNYSVINSNIIFKVLYQLISFPELPIQWADFTRVRMVCQLLRTVGEFFQNGSGKKKMDHFLTYWYRYYWMKRTQWVANAKEEDSPEDPLFPPEVVGEVEEALSTLRPSSLLPKSLDDAERQVEVLEQTFKDRVDSILAGEVQTEDGLNEEEEVHGGVRHRQLEEIAEEDEEEEGESAGVRMPRVAAVGSIDMDTEEEEDKVHVNFRKEPAILPEDMDFMRDLDRLISEAAKPTSATGPAHANLTVPAQARNKLLRRVGFADESPTKSKQIKGEEENESGVRVALMTRGKGNKAVLKTIGIHEERLERQWKENCEREKREREQLKLLTLHHSKRMAEEDEYGEFPPLG